MIDLDEKEKDEEEKENAHKVRVTRLYNMRFPGVSPVSHGANRGFFVLKSEGKNKMEKDEFGNVVEGEDSLKHKFSGVAVTVGELLTALVKKGETEEGLDEKSLSEEMQKSIDLLSSFVVKGDDKDNDKDDDKDDKKDKGEKDVIEELELSVEKAQKQTIAGGQISRLKTIYTKIGKLVEEFTKADKDDKNDGKKKDDVDSFNGGQEVEELKKQINVLQESLKKVESIEKEIKKMAKFVPDGNGLPDVDRDDDAGYKSSFTFGWTPEKDKEKK